MFVFQCGMFVFHCIIVGIGVWTVWYVCFSMYYSGNWCVDSVVCLFFNVL